MLCVSRWVRVCASWVVSRTHSFLDFAEPLFVPFRFFFAFSVPLQKAPRAKLPSAVDVFVPAGALNPHPNEEFTNVNLTFDSGGIPSTQQIHEFLKSYRALFGVSPKGIV